MHPHPWRWLLELAGFAVAMVGGFLVCSMAGAATGSSSLSWLLFMALPVVVSWGMERFSGGSWRTLGMGTIRTVFAGTGAGATMATVMLAVIVVTAVVCTSARIVGVADGRVGFDRLLQFGGAGVMEELLVHGALLRILSRRFGGTVAIIATAMVFAVLHLGNPAMSYTGFTNVLLAGLLMGVMVERLGSLPMAIAFHSGWNMLLALFVGAVSGNGGGGMIAALQLSGSYAWERLLTGGAFGVEESVLTTVGLASGILLLIRSPWYDAYTIAARERHRLGIGLPPGPASSVPPQSPLERSS